MSSEGSRTVSLGEFAEFIRGGGYFDMRLWIGHGEPAPGDEVLRRIGFRWNEQDRPVVKVTWYEAVAYCTAHRGRLPTREEARSRARSPEWCGGIGSRFPLAMYVARWDTDSVSPAVADSRIGFRLVKGEIKG